MLDAVYIIITSVQWTRISRLVKLPGDGCSRLLSGGGWWHCLQWGAERPSDFREWRVHIFITPLSLQYLVCSHQCWYYRQVTISRNISVPSCSCSGHLGHTCLQLSGQSVRIRDKQDNRATCLAQLGHSSHSLHCEYCGRRVAGSCNICVECRVMIKLWWYARSGQTKTQPQLSWLNKYLEALFNIVDTDQCYPGWISTSPSCQLRALSTLGHCQNGKCCSISFRFSRSVAPPPCVSGPIMETWDVKCLAQQWWGKVGRWNRANSFCLKMGRST